MLEGLIECYLENPSFERDLVSLLILEGDKFKLDARYGHWSIETEMYSVIFDTEGLILNVYPNWDMTFEIELEPDEERALLHVLHESLN